MSGKTTVVPDQGHRHSSQTKPGTTTRRDPARIEPRRTPTTEKKRARPEDLPAEVAAVFELGADAWRPFIRVYSPFILSCARRMASDYDERMEIYLHVCSRLHAKGCRRIRQFRGHGDSGSCKFTTWLAAVVFNLGKEWIRSKRGRRRIYRKIARLSHVDRLVFRYRFWEGFRVSEIATLLEVNHEIPCPDDRVVASLRRIRALMGRDHVWRLLVRDFKRGAHLSIGPSGPGSGDSPFDPRDRTLLPDESHQTESAVAMLQQAVHALPELERQAIRLKFSEGMNARTIAEVMGIRNYKRIYELQARAIVRIREDLVKGGVSLDDFGTQHGALELLK